MASKEQGGALNIGHLVYMNYHSANVGSGWLEQTEDMMFIISRVHFCDMAAVQVPHHTTNDVAAPCPGTPSSWFI